MNSYMEEVIKARIIELENELEKLKEPNKRKFIEKLLELNKSILMEKKPEGIFH